MNRQEVATVGAATEEVHQTETVLSDESTDSRPVWLNRLEDLARFNYLKVRFSMARAMLPAIIVGIIVFGATMPALRGFLGDDGAAGVGMALYALALFVGVGFGLRRSEARRAAEIRELAAQADARAIGRLASMVRGNVMAGSIFAWSVIRAIVESLEHLLSLVTDADASRTDEADRAELRSILTSCANHYGWLQARLFPPSFVAAALRGLTVLEDAPTLHVAERLVRVVGIGKRAKELREAALAALPGLRRVAQRVREREQLLRPAPPSVDAEVLVRPASGTSAGDEQVLVRPVDGA